jgi:hypothetical protein
VKHWFDESVVRQALARLSTKNFTMLAEYPEFAIRPDVQRTFLDAGGAVDFARSHNGTRNIFVNASPWSIPGGDPCLGQSEYFMQLPGTTSWGSMKSMMRQKYGRKLHLSSVGTFAFNWSIRHSN